MKQVNNINNIKMFYGINEHDNKVEIYDSNKKYFNDMYFDANDEEDIPAIIEMLKQTTLNDMCDFFNAKVYNSIKELSCNEELCEEDLKDNEYMNIFNIKNKTFYTWSE